MYCFYLRLHIFLNFVGTISKQCQFGVFFCFLICSKMSLCLELRLFSDEVRFSGFFTKLIFGWYHEHKPLNRQECWRTWTFFLPLLQTEEPVCYTSVLYWFTSECTRHSPEFDNWTFKGELWYCSFPHRFSRLKTSWHVAVENHWVHKENKCWLCSLQSWSSGVVRVVRCQPVMRYWDAWIDYCCC